MSLNLYVPKPLQIEVTPWFRDLGGLAQYTLVNNEDWQEIVRNELRAILKIHPHLSIFTVEKARGGCGGRTVLNHKYEDRRIPLQTSEICDFLAAHAQVHTLDKLPTSGGRTPTVFEMVHARKLVPHHRIYVEHEGEVVTKRVYCDNEDRYLRTLWRGPLFQRASASDFGIDYDVEDSA